MVGLGRSWRSGDLLRRQLRRKEKREDCERPQVSVAEVLCRLNYNQWSFTSFCSQHCQNSSPSIANVTERDRKVSRARFFLALLLLSRLASLESENFAPPQSFVQLQCRPSESQKIRSKLIENSNLNFFSSLNRENFLRAKHGQSRRTISP